MWSKLYYFIMEMNMVHSEYFQNLNMLWIYIFKEKRFFPYFFLGSLRFLQSLGDRCKVL